jgi:ABC-2 type transport system permease protein
MYFEAIAIAAELRDYPGGAQGLAQSLMPTLEAMRIIRWPADRLDTLGGYLAYHNVVLVGFFLAVFSAMQGARLMRQLEDHHNLDYLLSTGKSRGSILWIRSIAFMSLIVFISLGLGLGTAFAMWNSGEPDLSGSVITLLATGICILPFFGLGLVISQFVAKSRIAAGITVIVVTFIYAVGNIADRFDWLSWFKYLSPFYYANLSRPIIPGFTTNYWSWVLMVGVTLIFVAFAAWLMQRRDIGAPFETGVKLPKRMVRKGSVTHAPGSITGHILHRSRVGIIAWALASSALIGVFIMLMDSVLVIWEQMSFLSQFTSSGFGSTAAQQYVALTFEILPIFIAGYVISQASNWTADHIDGRVDLFLSTPTSWQKIVLNRIFATLIGALIIVSAVLVTVSVGVSLQGTDVDAGGLFRVSVMSLALALTLAALSAVLVRIFQRRSVILALSIYVAAAWLITFMQPYLEWPSWVLQLSIFHAFGRPYVEWPEFSDVMGISIITFTCLIGALINIRRRPAVIINT